MECNDNDLFKQWLGNIDKSEWMQIAVTDKSYKNKYMNKNKESYPDSKVNTDLATLGDAVLDLVVLDILYGNCELLSKEKEKYVGDRVWVTKIASHYDLLNYIKKDNNEKLPNDYNYDKHQSENHNSTKYIATCVEAIIGAIYKETNNLNDIKALVKDWMKLIKPEEK